MSAHDPAKIIFSCDLELRWGDLDAYNHLNNVSYFRFLEETRVRWFVAQRWTEDKSAKPILLKVGMTFLRSVLYPATLRITTQITEIGNSSVSLQHQILDANDPAIRYAEGYAKLVWIDTQTDKSVALPPYVRAALESARQ